MYFENFFPLLDVKLFFHNAKYVVLYNSSFKLYKKVLNINKPKNKSQRFVDKILFLYFQIIIDLNFEEVKTSTIAITEREYFLNCKEA